MKLYEKIHNNKSTLATSSWTSIQNIVGSSGSGKMNALLNQISHQPDIDKFFFTCQRSEREYQYFIKKCEYVGLKHCKNLEAFMEYSNDMSYACKSVEKYNLRKKRKVLVVFDDIIADMASNKKLYPIVVELFVRVRKLNISLVFIMQSYFQVPKEKRLSTIHFFIMKIPNKQEP